MNHLEIVPLNCVLHLLFALKRISKLRGRRSSIDVPTVYCMRLLAPNVSICSGLGHGNIIHSFIHSIVICSLTTRDVQVQKVGRLEIQLQCSWGKSVVTFMHRVTRAQTKSFVILPIPRSGYHRRR